MSINIAIDAINIRAGGGQTHLVRLLFAANPKKHHFNKITIWTSHSTAKHLPKKDWLEIKTPTWSEMGFFFRTIGQQFILPLVINYSKYDVIFSPGSILPLKSSVPMVTISQNMLPFEPDRALLFGRWSLMRLKLKILRIIQGQSFKRADGLIFLTKYAQDKIIRLVNGIKAKNSIIPHGIEERFKKSFASKATFNYIDSNKLIKLLYVSVKLPYKHQLEVIRAVSILRKEQVNIEITFVGGGGGRYEEEVANLIKENDPKGEYLHDLGHIAFESLHELYREANIFLFASSCENLPNILIEAMASGLPIICSDRGPMKEVLGDAGIYFDPESPQSIKEAIIRVINDPNLAQNLAYNGWKRAREYSWERCANQTFQFIEKIVANKVY